MDVDEPSDGEKGAIAALLARELQSFTQRRSPSPLKTISLANGHPASPQSTATTPLRSHGVVSPAAASPVAALGVSSPHRALDANMQR